MKHRIEYRVSEQDSRVSLFPSRRSGARRRPGKRLPPWIPGTCAQGLDAYMMPPGNLYAVRPSAFPFFLSLHDRTITSDDPRGGRFLGRYKDFFRLALLWYLTSAKDIPASGRLVRPVDVNGGHRFSTGTHLLPLDEIAERYKKDKSRFVQQGLAFGAEIVKYGDAGLRLYPLPRVPVTVILWLEDEEFPARVTLFFDSTVDYQLYPVGHRLVGSDAVCARAAGVDAAPTLPFHRSALCRSAFRPAKQLASLPENDSVLPVPAVALFIIPVMKASVNSLCFVPFRFTAAARRDASVSRLCYFS